MSTYNSETDYELMELFGLRDLKNARLILAKITYIDRIAKTATITVDEDCPEIENESLDEVPFFYHCEYSTGTIEDLEKGYKAFLENDYVYCLFVPEIGDQVKQFYIVGHADIRSTRLCLDNEYLLLRVTIGSDIFVTLFDTEGASKINLNEFESLPGSPAKPVSFPCLQNSMISWYNYNFIAPVIQHYIEGSLEFRNDVLGIINYGEVNGTGSNYTYTGQVYGDINFSIGNASAGGEYTVTQDDDIYNVLEDDVIYSYHLETTRSGIGKYPVGGGNYRAWWQSISEQEDTYVFEAEHMHIGTIISNSITYKVWSSFKYEQSMRKSISLTGDTSQIETADFTYSESFSRQITINFASIGRHNYEASIEWSVSSAGTIPKNILADQSYRSMTVGAQTFIPNTPGESIANDLHVYYWNYSMYDLPNCCKLGQYYVYSLIGGLKVEFYEPNSPNMTYEFIDSSNWPYPDVLYMSRNYNTLNLAKKIVCIADAGVTDIYGSLTQNKQDPTKLNLIDCLTKTSASKSAGLNNVIKEFFQYIINYYGYTSEEDIDDLIVELAKGPWAQVVKKKTV